MNEEHKQYDIVRSESTLINWLPGKKITHENVKKKQKNKKSKEVRHVEKEQERESFFNIFKTYEAPDEDDENADEELLDFVCTDLVIGQVLAEDIVYDPVGY